MTPEQAKIIAEREYPIYHMLDRRDYYTGERIFKDINMEARAAFINGLTYNKWIKVTPETKVDKEVLCVNEYGFMLLGYLSGNACENDYETLEYITHYQIIEPTKPDNV